MNYVGLTGIEIFDNKGNSIQIDEAKISACPPDINILPGYGGDPRTIDKLVDGHYFTNDDLHVWLTPFTAGDDHTITIEFPFFTTISMIRVWNYNKSRIHSYRGARLVTCELDGETIFRGEI
jgi:protein JBTS26